MTPLTECKVLYMYKQAVERCRRTGAAGPTRQQEDRYRATMANRLGKNGDRQRRRMGKEEEEDPAGGGGGGYEICEKGKLTDRRKKEEEKNRND